MTESTASPAGTPKTRAHERLSTGTWARWARFCATHPWRVVIGWVGIIAVLIGLVATVGGSLRDEFEIPGSDTQRATDLIESKFASEQGAVLNIVFAAPEGQRLDNYLDSRHDHFLDKPALRCDLDPETDPEVVTWSPLCTVTNSSGTVLGLGTCKRSQIILQSVFSVRNAGEAAA